jgi:hypothetical protein
MRPPIVDRRHLDILVLPPPIGPFVFDPEVREVDVVIEVREVVVVGPFLDLVRLAIGPAIRIVAVPISLVQPLLVLTLELVVEDDAIDARPAVSEALGFTEVRAIDLGVVFHLSRLLETRVERLLMFAPMVLRDVTPGRLQHVPTLLCQDDGHVPVALQSLGSDEPVLAEVSEVARPRIRRPLVVVAKVACRHDPKRADGRERAGFRSPQRVLTVSGIVDDLSVRSARQVEVPHEHVPRIAAQVSITRVAVALDLRLIAAISRIVFRMVVSRTA